MVALDRTLLLLDVRAVDLVEEERESEGDDVGKFLLHLLVVDLVRVVLHGVVTQRLAQDHDVPHEVLELLEPLLDNLLVVALHESRTEHVENRIDQAVLLLSLDLLSLVLLLAQKLLALALGLELQLDILQPSGAKGSKREAELASCIIWLVEALHPLADLLRVEPVASGCNLTPNQALSHQKLDVLLIF